MSNTWFRREMRKVTFRMGESETKINFVLKEKNDGVMKCEGNPREECMKRIMNTKKYVKDNDVEGGLLSLA